jgi:hypothetical protein
MTDLEGCLVLADATTLDIESPRCLGVGRVSAFSPSGAALAIESQDRARLLIVTGGEVVAHHPLPRGTTLQQVVYESETRQLLVVHARDGASHVLRCLGFGQCERVKSSEPGTAVVLAQGRTVPGR